MESPGFFHVLRELSTDVIAVVKASITRSGEYFKTCRGALVIPVRFRIRNTGIDDFDGLPEEDATLVKLPCITHQKASSIETEKPRRKVSHHGYSDRVCAFRRRVFAIAQPSRLMNESLSLFPVPAPPCQPQCVAPGRSRV